MRRAVDAKPRIESVEDWLAEVSEHRPSCVADMRKVVDHWRELGGYFEFGVGSLFLLTPLREPSGHGIWPCTIYSSGKIEVVFQYMAKRSVFQDELMREELRAHFNQIPGVTQLPPESLARRPGFDILELTAPGALDAYVEVLTWFHRKVQEEESTAGR